MSETKIVPRVGILTCVNCPCIVYYSYGYLASTRAPSPSGRVGGSFSLCGASGRLRLGSARKNKRKKRFRRNNTEIRRFRITGKRQQARTRTACFDFIGFSGGFWRFRRRRSKFCGMAGQIGGNRKKSRKIVGIRTQYARNRQSFVDSIGVFRCENSRAQRRTFHRPWRSNPARRVAAQCKGIGAGGAERVEGTLAR